MEANKLLLWIASTRRAGPGRCRPIAQGVLEQLGMVEEMWMYHLGQVVPRWVFGNSSVVLGTADRYFASVLVLAGAAVEEEQKDSSKSSRSLCFIKALTPPPA